ncbi:uncharacterized protein LOC108099763 [Drosophila ficusphila]|uniref:uncharacterized protein LOC108099763 n=1 Tax=Drosophila ficusphila TaxID=30025 RepID=UPI0007E6CE9A|nr:uncharacterized protein LOC108099763 [Drosophila ficusphila]
MVGILPFWRWVLRPFRLHYGVVFNVALLCLLGLGVLDYGYFCHGWDLLWWRHLLMQEEITPLSVLLHIGGVKLVVILGLALWSSSRKAAGEDRQVNQEMPIAYVRKRYCRFLVMRLLASLDKLIHQHPQMEDFLQRHTAFCTAVELFRWDARKLFERSDLQLTLPLHEVLAVKDCWEENLLQNGYGERLHNLRELDIHRMVYDS